VGVVGGSGVLAAASARAKRGRARRKSVRVNVVGSSFAPTEPAAVPDIAPVLVTTAEVPEAVRDSLPPGVPPPVSEAVAASLAKFPAARSTVIVMGDLNYRVEVEPGDAVGLICQAAANQKVGFVLCVCTVCMLCMCSSKGGVLW